MEVLTVKTRTGAYPIFFAAAAAPALRQAVADLQADGRLCFAVVDARVAPDHAAFLDEVLGDMPRHPVPSGEGSKSFTELAALTEAMAAAGVDRTGRLVAFGGGVTGDLAGFAAACYLRGIPFLQVPTTLLAMVDSSVGGKTGINLAAGKNLVGAFHQPEAVFIDFTLLATLPTREFAAGMAEIIKYGMLADAELFTQLESLPPLDADAPQLPAIVRRCCEIKAEVVAADERETSASGGRALLNLGHTFAHAIEAVAGYGTYLHGEAVAIGLACATQLSVELGWLPEQAYDRVTALCQRYALPTCLRAPLASDALLAAMRRDKKVRAGRLRFVALRALGEAVTVDAVELTLIHQIITHHGAA